MAYLGIFPVDIITKMDGLMHGDSLLPSTVLTREEVKKMSYKQQMAGLLERAAV